MLTGLQPLPGGDATVAPTAPLQLRISDAPRLPAAQPAGRTAVARHG